MITGASSGIGETVSRMVHRLGANVALAARSADKLEAIAHDLGARTCAWVLDVSDEAAVGEVFRQIRERFGPVDVLINNAGFGSFEPVSEANSAILRGMMDVNYFGMVHCTRAVLTDMLARRSGHIVNVASVAGKFATAKSAGYSATKHAVLGFTNALRQELHGSGVHVTAVNPGPVQTAFFEIADPEGGYVNNVRSIMVSPERVAQAMIRGIEKRKAEVNVPGWLGAAAGIGQLLPAGLVNGFASRFLRLK